MVGCPGTEHGSLAANREAAGSRGMHAPHPVPPIFNNCAETRLGERATKLWGQIARGRDAAAWLGCPWRQVPRRLRAPPRPSARPYQSSLVKEQKWTGVHGLAWGEDCPVRRDRIQAPAFLEEDSRETPRAILAGCPI